jgi:hypothetical protein
MRRAGTCSRQFSIANQADICCRETGVASPPTFRGNGEALSSTINIRAAKVLFYLAGIQDKRKALRQKAGGLICIAVRTVHHRIPARHNCFAPDLVLRRRHG